MLTLDKNSSNIAYSNLRDDNQYSQIQSDFIILSFNKTFIPRSFFNHFSLDLQAFSKYSSNSLDFNHDHPDPRFQTIPHFHNSCQLQEIFDERNENIDHAMADRE
jgi:hypothetical protein